MTTEQAIKALDPLLEDLRYWIAQDPPGTASRVCAERRERVAALAHLISEARRVEKLREWGEVGVTVATEWDDGYREAQKAALEILSSPSPETEK
jgi:hypothetical protein